jgi:hypothetical protein
MNLSVFWLPLSFTYLREKKHSSYLLDVVASVFKKCEFQGDAVWHPYILKVKLLTVSHMYLPLNFDNSSVFKASSRRRLGDKASRKLRRPGRLIFSALLFFPFLFPISLLFQAFF